MHSSRPIKLPPYEPLSSVPSPPHHSGFPLLLSFTRLLRAPAMVDIEKCNTYESSAPLRDRKDSLATQSATAVDEVRSLPPSSVMADNSIFPDGGARAWLTVFGAFLALFCTFGQLNSFGTFQAWYAEHQLHGLPPSTISWIGSLQLWVFFFSVSEYAPPVCHIKLTRRSRREGSSVACSMRTARDQS